MAFPVIAPWPPMRIPDFFVKVLAACGNADAQETRRIQVMSTKELTNVRNLHCALSSLEPGAAPLLLPRATFITRAAFGDGRLHSVTNPAPRKDPMELLGRLPNPFRIPRPHVKPLPPPALHQEPLQASELDHINVRRPASQLEDRSSWLHNVWRQQDRSTSSSPAYPPVSAMAFSVANDEHVIVQQDPLSNQVAWQSDVMPPTDSISFDSACPSTTNLEQSICSDSEPGEDWVDSGWDEEWPPLTDEEQREADAQFAMETYQLESLEASTRGQFYDVRSTVDGTPVSEPVAQKPVTQLMTDIVTAAQTMAARRGHFTDPRVDRSRSGAKESLALSKAGKALFNGMDAMLRTHEGQLTRAADDSGNASHAFDATSDGWASESEA